MAERWLLMGFSKALLGGLGRLEKGSVTVLEEPDVWRKKDLAGALGQYPMVGEVLFGEYFDSDGFMTVARAAHAAEPFSAIVPGVEYAVPAAALAAEELGLPGAGPAAAAALRNKLLLRELTSRAGVPNPRFMEVSSAEDIERFAAGGPLVVKPAGRQASLGVHLLDSVEDAGAVWSCLQSEREGVQLPDRDLPMAFLAEERLRGTEHSVEALVVAGEPVFTNVTRKSVLEGEFPVETGHLVPAPLSSDERDELDRVTRLLLRTTGFRDGIIHAEWVVCAGGPVLIECAGRMPGDHIMDLIGLAYGFDPFGALVDVLSGRWPRLAPGPAASAAIGFVTAPPGTASRVGDPVAVGRMPGVVSAEIGVAVGSEVGPCRSSWDRLGHVIVTGRDSEEARSRLASAMEALAVETK